MKLARSAVMLFTLFLLLFAATTTYAAKATTPPVRFQDIIYDNVTIGQFDKQTLKYEKDPYRDEVLVNVWIKTPLDSFNQSYTMYNYLLRTNTREMMMINRLDFDNSGNMLQNMSNKYNPALWTLVLPETATEKWYNAVTAYAKKNNKKLQQEYTSETKKEKRSQPLLGPFNHIFDMLSGN
ncbi:hypothetical protein [Anaerospora hongkongensis]|uniref:hypothetical protein n=1 Tax=Anaerospora hongkongensis TaxID=244830 RepID=UPI0028994C07|nr:hypothetical protein [Anaerospora hongkongensis]